MIKSIITPAALCFALALTGITLAGCSQEQSPNASSASQSTSTDSDSSSASTTSSSSVNSEKNRDLKFDDIPQDAVINAEQLHGLLEGDSAPFVLDVRSSGQYTNAFIEGSKNIPAGRQLDIRLDEIPHDRDIVIISKEQERLGEVWQTLLDAGFDQSRIKAVSDGMDGWIAAGYPTDSRESLGC